MIDMLNSFAAGWIVMIIFSAYYGFGRVTRADVVVAVIFTITHLIKSSRS